MRTTVLRKAMLCLLLLALLLSATACDDRAMLAELGARFLPEILAYKFGGSTGNLSLDALLGAKTMLDRIDQADTLMEQGWENGDPAKMEEAIALRPTDWNYRVDAASMYLAQDDVEATERHLRAAEEALPDDATAQLQHSQKIIDQFESIKESGDEEGYTSLEQCIKVHGELVKYYNRQWAMRGNSGLSPAVQAISQEQQRCPEMLQP
jgi:hypothetical protein